VVNGRHDTGRHQCASAALVREPDGGVQQQERCDAAGKLGCGLPPSAGRIVNEWSNLISEPERRVFPQRNMGPRLKQPQNPEPGDEGGAKLNRSGEAPHRLVTPADAEDCTFCATLSFARNTRRKLRPASFFRSVSDHPLRASSANRAG